MALFLALPTLLALSWTPSEAPDRRALRAWCSETADRLERSFWDPAQRLYADFALPSGDRGGRTCFLWGMGVLLSAYAAAIPADPARYRPLFDRALKAIEPYWSEARGIGGYAVWPRQDDPDRYHDDNAWVALALVEAHEATKNPAYLERSVRTHRFVMSGEDEKLGGGLYWHEKNRQSKNACSCGPAIVTALRLHRATRDREYLRQAQRLRDWMRRNLQDPEDGLYWDNIRLDGRIEKTKWTYNTALMLRAECLLFDATKDAAHRREALRVAEAAWRRWWDPEIGSLKDEAQFAHHLFEAFFEVARITGDRTWIERAMPALGFVRERTRNQAGLYGSRWDRAPESDRREFQLLHTASALRAYAYALVHGQAVR
ncbi:MAG: glycoside hydrolase family 76 protein [Fimbriimonadales bacterium]|nr:glycoside hydrolase family 76 protein [Fimbriimonadales bacterium]